MRASSSSSSSSSLLFRRLYVIGMNTIPDSSLYPASLVSEVRRARDASILLAGHRPYREFPIEWMTRHLEKYCE